MSEALAKATKKRPKSRKLQKPRRPANAIPDHLAGIATPERLRKAGPMVEPVKTDGQRFGEMPNTLHALDGHVLEFLSRRKQIEAEQYYAGSQFYRDWYLSGLAQSGVVDPSKDVVSGGGHDKAVDRQIDAMTRYNAALRSLNWLHADCLINVVLREMSVEDYGIKTQSRWYKDSQRRTTAVMTTLRNGLDSLVKHYEQAKTWKSRARKPHTSAQEGYRPTLTELDIE